MDRRTEAGVIEIGGSTSGTGTVQPGPDAAACGFKEIEGERVLRRAHRSLQGMSQKPCGGLPRQCECGRPAVFT